ncbi:hypothetical protein [Chitinophaga sp. CF418]|uniref:hypothetical protein n=1 Tax=Chitinophaga sp. CF418 TaxID=1855287 RepID=UPI00091147DA|nr:hypothetical protein [Chitinophaga sp. CF418]SHN45143.1 hypothetical protein SAMN05216311_11921 [Chitinophaga sp. CF418]
MKTELYKALKGISVESLSEEDKEELLRFFVVAKTDVIRNQIAFIFSDANFNKAIPFIIDKINDKNLSHNNGSLVYALENLDVKEYFIDFIKMVCEMEYEPRYQAYEIVQKFAPTISKEVREKALKLLEERQMLLQAKSADTESDSPLNFVEQTIELLQNLQQHSE